jgi:hypothetical protein
MLKRIVATTILTLTITTTSPALASESRSKTFRCPEAMKVAKQAGWRNHQLQQLDFIIYREAGTTCNPASIGWNYQKGKTHKDCRGKRHWYRYRLCPYIRSTDFGYTQINDRTWVSYLKQLDIIDHEKQLLHPRTNLVAAKALYDYAVDRGIDGWTAWHTNKPNGSGNVSK